MFILLTVLHAFLEVLARRICLTIKGFFSWWSFPLLRGDIYEEKLDVKCSKGSNIVIIIAIYITHLDIFGVHLRLKTVIVHPHAYIYHYILTVDICSTCHVCLSSPVNLQRCLYRMVSQYMYFFTFSLFGEV